MNLFNYPILSIYYPWVSPLGTIETYLWYEIVHTGFNLHFGPPKLSGKAKTVKCQVDIFIFQEKGLGYRLITLVFFSEAFSHLTVEAFSDTPNIRKGFENYIFSHPNSIEKCKLFTFTLDTYTHKTIGKSDT